MLLKYTCFCENKFVLVKSDRIYLIKIQFAVIQVKIKKHTHFYMHTRISKKFLNDYTKNIGENSNIKSFEKDLFSFLFLLIFS